MNLFFRSHDVPLDYGHVTVEQVQEATRLAIEKSRKIRDDIVNSDVSDVAGRLLSRDDLDNSFERIMMPMYLLKETHPDDSVREACQDSVEALYRFDTELSLDEDLYQSLEEFASFSSSLSPTLSRYLKKTLDAYHRNGFRLSKEHREKLKRIDDELNAKTLEFQKNVTVCQDFLVLNEIEMEGLPDDFKRSHQEADGSYKVTIQQPDYVAVTKFAKRGSVRKRMYHLYQNRVVDVNLPLLDEIIKLRVKRSELLGFKTYAEYRQDSLMAGKPERVWSFIKELSSKVAEKAREDYRRLCKSEGVDDFPIWDKRFITNRYKEQSFELDEKTVQEYFPFEKVTEGLFDLAESLYSISFRKNDETPVWHKDVWSFDVIDNDEVIARFYLDMYPRDNKYNHAACFGLQGGKLLSDGSYQTPEAALVCNFPKPRGNTPSLLTHDNVETYFHEFGHLMHQLLTKAELVNFSGTSVERDFVEMPSQIMENWVWERDSLKRFAHHYETNEPMPDTLIDRLLAVRHINTGIEVQLQLFYTAVDMTFHDGFVPDSARDTTDVVERLHSEYTVFEMPEGTAFQASFHHLMSYAASYYGYLWSCVYADDMFSVFKKEGLFNPSAGNLFRKEVLAKGDTVAPMTLMKTFLGREPEMDAYLANQGIK